MTNWQWVVTNPTGRITPVFLVVLSLQTLCADRLESSHAAKKVKVREEVAVIDTNLGRISFRFFNEESPKTVEAFKSLVRAKYYDGTLFDRVLPGLLVQGGDQETREPKDASPQVEFEPLSIEINDLRHNKGTVSMAHERGEDMSTSEFFICLQEVTYFDGKYTIIGEIISGIEVAVAISNVPRNLKQAPLFPVRIKRISLEVQEYLREVR